MFCGHDFIKIYLMILIIIFSLYYCELEETTVLKRFVSNSKMKAITNYLDRRKRVTNKYLNLHHKKRKSNSLKKHNFNHEIFKENLQLMKDLTKTSLFKLQNSDLENSYIGGEKNKYIKLKYTTSLPIDKSNNEKYKLRKRDDETDTAENGEETNTHIEVTEGNRQLLQEIVEELDEIRESSVGPGHGKFCQLNGTWVSETVGIAFNISFHQNEIVNITVNNTNTRESSEIFTTTTTTTTPKPLNYNETFGGVVDLNTFEVQIDESIDHKPLLNCSWSMSARVPFSHLKMLIITAEYAPLSHVAVFVGQCRYCDKTEMVIGQWMVHKYAHDCRKVPESQVVYGDVLRRQPKT